MASMGLNIEEQKAVERFRTEVVEPSKTKLVIVDFWAEWCGPCKALTPVLEKVAADYADKGVVLAKINVDEEKFIASQFQVQSIPTVYAMFQGQPVADLTSKKRFGCLIANPPYGERLEEKSDVERLYRSMRPVLDALDSWSHFILTTEPKFEAILGRKATRRRKLYNARLACTYYQFLGPRPPRRESQDAQNRGVDNTTETATE